MKSFLWIPAVAIPFMLASCGAAAHPAQHASVLMRDGTTVSGMVTDSSAAEIRLTGDDKVARIIPMGQVRSVDYDDPPAPAAAVATPAVATAAAPPLDPVHERHYHPSQSAITTKTSELPPGTVIQVRNEETIDSARASQGQTFAAEVTRDVRDSAGDVVIPRGANARIFIKSASRGGKFQGASDLVLDLDSVSIDGREYQLDTSNVSARGRNGVGLNRRTGEFAGGGAAVGAIIGAIAGHGQGAAIGAGAGAGAGVLGEVLTKGDSVRVPVESVLTFRLETPLRVVAAQ